MSSEAPRPVAEGSLDRTPLTHVFVHIGLRGFDGTLALWPDDPRTQPGQDRILFDGGVAVRMRPLEPVASLDRGLGALFGRRRAPYALYGADLVGRGPRVVEGRADPWALAARALRGPAAQAEAAAMDRVIERLGTAPVRMGDAEALARLALEDDERAVVERLGRPVPPKQLIGEWPDPSLPRRVLYLLALTRALTVTSANTGPHERPRRAEEPATTTPAPRTSSGAHGRAPSSSPGHMPRQSGAPTAPPTAPAPPTDLDPELSRRWSEIVARAEAIEGQTYFDMLGVRATDGEDEVRGAYLDQVRRWHPDRLPPQLAALAPWVERIFHHVTEARDTLSDPTRREEYIELVKSGGGTPDADRRLGAIVGSALEFQKVEVLSRRKSWDEALQILRGALEMNPEDPDFHAMHAWLLFQKHGADEGAPVDDMLGSADRALGLDDRCVRAHYVKGVLLKQLGRGGEALRHFQRATELDPRHLEAAREVRLAEMRERNSLNAPAESGRPSLLGKLFGAAKKK